MILHIFKKDIRVLWPYILGTAGVDLAAAILHATIEAFQIRGDLEALNLFTMAGDLIALLFGFTVTVMVVQLDAIPGARQDWLARPIRRRDLLLAKLLFLAVFVQGSSFVADTVHGLAAGFPLTQTFAAAGARNLYLFALMTLPAMALAAMTESIKQALGIGLAVAVGALAVAGAILEFYVFAKVTPDNGHTMTSFVLEMTLLVAGAAAILALQYFQRATLSARLVLVVAAVAVLGARLLLPQDAAYAIEERLSSGPGREVFLAFAPEAGRAPVGIAPNLVAGTESRTDQSLLIGLPLTVSGLPSRLLLIGDVRAVITAADGASVILNGSNFPVQQGRSGSAVYYQMLRVPSDFFAAHQSQPMRVELNYELAVHSPQKTYDLPAVGGEIAIPNVAHCATSVGPFRTNILLRCMQVGQERMRVTVALTDAAKDTGIAGGTRYSPSDAPYRNGDAVVTRFGGGVVLRSAFANGPSIDPPRFSQINMRLTASEPLQYVFRRVVIPDVRLSAWIVNEEGAL
jgi:hypothetical protein